MILYFLSLSEKKNDKILTLKSSVQIDDDFKDDYFVDQIDMKKEIVQNEKKIKLQEVDDSYFEILFLEETWIEIYSLDNSLVQSGLYKIGDTLNFVFENAESDFFIKSGNLGGFQIFFKDEFFAPFGYSGEVNKGFYLKKKYLSYKIWGYKKSVRPWRDIQRKTRKIKVGDVEVGGDSPISVQSMTNTLTTDIKATVQQIKSLENVGADLVESHAWWRVQSRSKRLSKLIYQLLQTFIFTTKEQ